MNEEPTIPIGLAPSDVVVRSETPAPTQAWGSFILLARVGFGGFGEVYRAWDPHLQREVALKLLLPGVVGDEAEYEAMLREARALASVRHPNIVPVHGIDRHDGRVGFWTDFVRGRTLSAVVHEQGTFGPREAAIIGLDVTRALSAVHRAGLLHRDIKAENVMREEGGRILLMDFGLSALEQRQTNIAGTPNYMAPELFSGGRSTTTTDIYAMGVLLYYLVAGDYPVRLRGLTATEAMAALSKRRPLMDLRPDLPENLLRTVSTAMEIDPAKRFSSAGELANALAESLGTHAPAELQVLPESGKGFRGRRAWVLGSICVTMAVAVAVWPGLLQKLIRRSPEPNTTLSAANQDQFEKAQALLLRSYKEANRAEAVKGLEEVLKVEPNNALAEARLGLAHFIQYRESHDAQLLDKARQETSQAIKLEPDLADPYITLSRISAMQGQTQLATQQANEALKRDPRSAEAHGALGEVYEAEGRGKDALDEYQKASDLAPEDWRWPVSLGVAEFGQGNLGKCISDLQRGIKLAPDNAVAYFDLSIAHQQSNELSEARKDLEASIANEPTARAYSALGSLLLLEHKYDEAADEYKRAIQLEPNSYDAYEGLAAAYNWSGAKRDLAVQTFRKAIELEEADRAKRPHEPILLASLADNYASVGNSGSSFVLATQALALAADNPDVEYKAGEAFEILGQRQRAIPLIAKALSNGYRANEFERNPELASLRSDARFIAALNDEKSKKK